MNVLVITDEVITLGLTGLPEARSMNADLKKGLAWVEIMHSPKTGDERADELIDQGCTQKVIFACSPAVAATLAAQLDVNLDPYKEHSREVSERSLADGYEEYGTLDFGETRDEYGNKSGSNTRRGRRERQRHRTVQDVQVKWFDLPAQQTMNAVGLMRLSNREFYFVDGGVVTGPHYTEDLQSAWHLPGTFEEAVAEHLAWQRAVGISRAVVDAEESCPTPTTPSTPKPAAKPRQPQPPLKQPKPGTAAKVKGKPGKKPTK